MSFDRTGGVSDYRGVMLAKIATALREQYEQRFSELTALADLVGAQVKPADEPDFMAQASEMLEGEIVRQAALSVLARLRLHEQAATP